jgi:taurine dioxygenase
METFMLEMTTVQEPNDRVVPLKTPRGARVEGFDRNVPCDAVLDDFAEYARQACFHPGHVRQLGDAILWDNRCTMYCVDIDYPLVQRRIMHRVLINGPRPF